jgi:hypothetical protein
MGKSFGKKIIPIFLLICGLATIILSIGGIVLLSNLIPKMLGDIDKSFNELNATDSGIPTTISKIAPFLYFPLYALFAVGFILTLIAIEFLIL